MEKNLEPLTCLQKVLCWITKRSVRRVRSGQGESMDKIIDGLVTSEWLKKFFGDTIFKGSIENGIYETNCAKGYSACKINRNDFQNFVNDLFDGFV